MEDKITNGSENDKQKIKEQIQAKMKNVRENNKWKRNNKQNRK